MSSPVGTNRALDARQTHSLSRPDQFICGAVYPVRQKTLALRQASVVDHTRFDARRLEHAVYMLSHPRDSGTKIACMQ